MYAEKENVLTHPVSIRSDTMSYAILLWMLAVEPFTVFLAANTLRPDASTDEERREV